MKQEDMIQFFPEIYEQRYSVKVLPTLKTSVTATLQHYLQTGGKQQKPTVRQPIVSFKTQSDVTGKRVPVDTVLVFANDEFESNLLYFVPLQRYLDNITPFGYVIDEDLDELRVLV